MILVFLVILGGALSQNIAYSVEVISKDADPLMSWRKNNTAYPQTYNAAFLAASSATNGKEGLFARVMSQVVATDKSSNCTNTFYGYSPSRMVFTEYDASSNTLAPAVFENEIFGPIPGLEAEMAGTEDPRLTYDATLGRYFLTYTAVGPSNYFLALASSATPLNASSWTRHGSVIPSSSPLYPHSKSGAILSKYPSTSYMLWGDTDIRLAISKDLIHWDAPDFKVLSPRPNMFDSKLVEAGPAPVQLSTGDYLFIHNSADQNLTYHVSWAVLDKNNVSHVLQRADVPLISPTEPWERGWAPEMCNVPNVVFCEGLKPLQKQDTFQLFFGGADAVIGTATIQVNHQ